MVKEKKIGSIKRFGARYGRKVKQRFGEIELQQRKLHKCPYCNQVRAKRVSVGIWYCKKCKTKFTGRAYSIKEEKSLEKEMAKGENIKKEEKRGA